jgi:hypothetical protein
MCFSCDGFNTAVLTSYEESGDFVYPPLIIEEE